MKQLSNSIIANFSLLCYPGTSADAQVQVRTTLASLAGEISSLHSLNVTLFSFGYAEWHSNEGWNIIWKAVSEDKKMVKSLKGSFADWPSFDGITIAVAASQWRSGTKTAKVFSPPFRQYFLAIIWYIMSENTHLRWKGKYHCMTVLQCDQIEQFIGLWESF